jgi:hypothetical protein
MTIASLRKALQPSLLGRSILPALPAALALVVAGSWQPAQALLTYNIFETSGGDVVVETSGSLNLGSSTFNTSCSSGVITSIFAVICSGVTEPLLGYAVSGPTSFDGTVNIFPGTSASGISTFLNGGDFRGPTFAIGLIRAC